MKMRIAYLSLDYGIPVLGGKGGSVHIREMLEAFCSLGHSVHLFCSHLGHGTSLEDQNLVVTEYAAPLETSARAGEESFAPEHRFWKERRYRRTAARIETLVAAHHAATPFDFVYERYSLWSAAGARLGRRLAIPSVFEVNAPLVQEQAKYRQLHSADMAIAVEAEILATADALLAVSDGVADYLVSSGASPGSIHVVPNGVNPDKFRPDVPPAPIADWGGAPVVGFTGGLKAWHGIEDLVEAFRMVKQSVPAAKLLIVGDGPMRTEIERLAQSAGVARDLLITGWLAHDDIPRYVARMDVAVAPYPAITDFYFSPLKLFEYLAAGRAIITTAVAQKPEIIRDGENGMIVPPSNPGALADKLCSLLNDAGLCRQLGRSARLSAKMRTWQANAGCVIDIIDKRAGRPTLETAMLQEVST